MDNKKWFKDAKFGMMVHWGLYSLLGGEWKGKRVEAIAEWIQHTFRIPVKEYEKLAKAFNPIYFNAQEWVDLAKDAGMQYMVVTAKHHDGFCMYHTKVDKWNIVDATPFKRDVIKELAECCYKNGMKFGIYYSQEMDWHEPNGAGKVWPADEKLKNTVYWENDWDYPIGNKDFSQCFNDKIKPQLKELLTKYGDLLLIWCDDPCEITPKQSQEVYDWIKSFQPDCLVPSRVGNGLGDIYSFEDNKLPEENWDGLGEACVTMNDTWGYKSFDNHWKSVDEILGIKEKCNSRGVNLLLNVGPDALGRIPAPSIEILREIGKRNKKNI
jgi:alpha-L-fucosidase